MKAPRLTDSTLRDGSHAMRHQFTRAHVRDVAQALDQAGVQVFVVADVPYGGTPDAVFPNNWISFRYLYISSLPSNMASR